MNEKENPSMAESKDNQLSFNLQLSETNEKDIKLTYKDLYFLMLTEIITRKT